MNALRRFIGLAGVLGTLWIGLAAASTGLVGTAFAAGGGDCGGGGGGPTPGPTQVLASRFSGLVAFATVEAVSGTTETDIFVTAQQATFNTAGTKPTSGSQAFLGITVHDIVTGDLFVEAFGCTASPDFQIDTMLTTATLGLTSIPVFDSVSNTTSTAVVSADWTGVGDVTRSASAGVFHSGDFTVTTNFVGFFRNADASLSLSDPALNVSFEGAATYAELDNVRNGAADVCVLSSCTGP